MHDMVPAVKQTQSLQEMLYTKNIILNDIYENDGEITDEEDNQLMQLDISLPAKVDAWAWMLMNNGGIDKEIELLIDRKKAIDEIIHKLKSTKDRMKVRANDILRHNGLERIDGVNFWFKRDVSRTSRVIMSKVEDHYKSYELPKLSYDEYEQLIYVLESEPNIYTMMNLVNKLKTQNEENCGVKSLPKDHPAIDLRETPTIMIYQRR